MSGNPFSNMPKLGVPQIETNMNRASSPSGYDGSPYGGSAYGGNSILKGPTPEAFDNLKTAFDEAVFKLKSIEIKCEQFETVNKRMAVVELNSNKVGVSSNGAIEEFKIHVASFKDRI